MNRVIVFCFLCLAIISCKKGFVLRSASIKNKNSISNTDVTLIFNLVTDAYYKGKKIEVSATKWTIYDSKRVYYTPLATTANAITFKADNPGEYTIKADFNFDTKDKNTSTKEIVVTVAPSYAYLKHKLIGNFANNDAIDPNFNLSLIINPDYSYTAMPDTAHLQKSVFYKALNIFNNCKINIDTVDIDAKLSGTITVLDSATSNIRVDYIKELTFKDSYNTLIFKQVYAYDSNQYRYFELNRK